MSLKITLFLSCHQLCNHIATIIPGIILSIGATAVLYWLELHCIYQKNYGIIQLHQVYNVADLIARVCFVNKGIY